MKAISINLARRPFYNSTLYLVAYGVAIVVLLTMTTLNVVTFVADRMVLNRLGQAQETLRQEIDSLDRDAVRIRRSLESSRLSRLQSESHFVQNALLQRHFSWTDLFNRLEVVQPPDVLLQSIRPAIEQDQINIRVNGLAKTPDAFTDFEEALIKSPIFSDVYPTSELWYGEQRGLQFELGFCYLPDRAPDEATEPPAEEPPAEEAAAAGTIPPSGPVAGSGG